MLSWLEKAGAVVTRRNLITDVAGVLVGQAHDEIIQSGVTVVLFDRPAVAAVDIRGGGPGTRETALLDPARTVEAVDAIALAGGSAFGLDAASGAQAWLAEHGRGFAVGAVRVPIVPAAILFDLLAGGDKEWGRYPPYRELGYSAAAAAGQGVALGSVGAGRGATTVDLKGGIGSASAVTRDGFAVGALAAINPAGSVVIGDGPHFWAAPFEQGSEFGSLGHPPAFTAEALAFRTKGTVRASTTLVVVATDATLTKPQAKRLAVMAQTGLARAIYPVHTPLDGDVVFAAATGSKAAPDSPFALAELGALAANTVARAVARGVYEATPLPVANALPSWRDRHDR
jgi:D-aminopeptidase